MNEPNQKLSRLGKIRAVYKKYEGSIFPVAFATPFFLWQIFVVSNLDPVPGYGELAVLHGEITRARSAPPEFLVQLPDGKKLEMEWPASYLLIDTSTRNGPYWGDNKKLLGCQAEIKYAPTRFTLTEHLRIWDLSCSNKKIQVSSNELIKDFKRRGENTRFIFSLVLGLVYICSFIRFLYDRKNHS